MPVLFESVCCWFPHQPETQPHHTHSKKTDITPMLLVLEVPECSLRIVYEKLKHVEAYIVLI